MTRILNPFSPLLFVCDTPIFYSIPKKSKIVPLEDSDAKKAFSQKNCTISNINYTLEQVQEKKSVFIKIKPNNKIHCYSLGVDLMEIAKNNSIESYSVLNLDISLILIRFVQNFLASQGRL
jgi:hypothetical protein